jgi:hypothetical protein
MPETTQRFSPSRIKMRLVRKKHSTDEWNFALRPSPKLKATTVPAAANRLFASIRDIE